jgi:hypothetical protein
LHSLHINEQAVHLAKPLHVGTRDFIGLCEEGCKEALIKLNKQNWRISLHTPALDIDIFR